MYVIYNAKYLQRNTDKRKRFAKKNCSATFIMNHKRKGIVQLQTEDAQEIWQENKFWQNISTMCLEDCPHIILQYGSDIK